MFCKNCGKQIEEGSKFCKECGATVSRSSGDEESMLTEKEKVSLSFINAIVFRGIVANFKALRENLIVTEVQKKSYEEILIKEKNKILEENQDIFQSWNPEHESLLNKVFKGLFI
jgi:uncharacterized membrane protein YvbJ